jgi:hypothetical protein
MSTFRTAVIRSCCALAFVAVSGCSTVSPPYLMPMWSEQAPTIEETQEHWRFVMSAVDAKSIPDVRAGLSLLTTDARSTPMDEADRQYAMVHLQRVSYHIDQDDWAAAKEQLTALRWRYGRF